MIGLIIGIVAGASLAAVIMACCFASSRYDLEKVVHCRHCAKRDHCQLRTQAIGDDGFCSLGWEVE